MAPLLALGLALAADFDTWAGRGDAAAANLREHAETLAATADAIVADGRATRFAALRSDADQLVRRAELLETLVAAEP